MSDHGFSGMTVNERLFVAGMFDRWDAAMINGDRDAAIGLLNELGLANQAAWIVDQALVNRNGRADS